MNLRYLRLCLVTYFNQVPFPQYQQFILQAARGGITSVQLRDKKESLVLLTKALQLKKILTPFHVPLIINNHVRLAKDIDAEGVHIGQGDMSPEKARAILGPDKIIGLSIESFEELERANQYTHEIDYVAASAVFPSKIKQDCKKIWGLDALSEFRLRAKHPVVGIGGIKHHNVVSIMQTGIDGVAVVGAIHDAPNPEHAAKQMISQIDDFLGEEKTCRFR